MKILHYYNWGYFEPITSGADLIASNQLEYCRSRGWDVDILLLAHPDRAHQADAFRQRYSWVRSVRLVELRLGEFTFRDQLALHQRIARSDTFLDLARQGHDLFLANYVFSAPLIEAMPKCCIKLLEALDIVTESFALNERIQRAERDPMALARDAFLWNVERELYRLFDGVLFINEKERDVVDRSCPRRAHFVPPMMPWEVASEPEDAGGTAPERTVDVPFDLLFVGSNAPPNVQGLTSFYENVFVPYLRKREVRMAIIGKVCESVDFEDWYVTKLGVVPGDLRAEYERAKLVIIPLLEGTGLSIKTIECLASGRAVAATPVGARGLPREPEAFLQIDMAGDPRGSADAILELLRSDARRLRMQQHARAYYRRNFGRDRFFRAMDGVMNSLRIAS